METLDAIRELGPVMTALGSTTRQRILMLFKTSKSMDVNDIADHFNLSRTAVVHHIAVLRDAGVIKPNGSANSVEVDWKLVSKTLHNAQAIVAPLAEASN